MDEKRSENVSNQPNVLLTYHDFSVSSQRIAHTDEGSDDGSDLSDLNKEGRYWRQYNFYFSAKQSGKYIDPDSVKFNTGSNYARVMSSYKNGYRISVWLSSPSRKTLAPPLWNDSLEFQRTIEVSNGDPHAFCLTYIVTFDLRYARSRQSWPITGSFYIDSSMYSFCPKYADLSFSDLEELIRSSDDKVIDTLLTLNSSSPQCPPDIIGDPGDPWLLNVGSQRYLCRGDNHLMSQVFPLLTGPLISDPYNYDGKKFRFDFLNVKNEVNIGNSSYPVQDLKRTGYEIQLATANNSFIDGTFNVFRYFDTSGFDHRPWTRLFYYQVTNFAPKVEYNFTLIPVWNKISFYIFYKEVASDYADYANSFVAASDYMFDDYPKNEYNNVMFTKTSNNYCLWQLKEPSHK